MSSIREQYRERVINERLHAYPAACVLVYLNWQNLTILGKLFYLFKAKFDKKQAMLENTLDILVENNPEDLVDS